MKGDSQLNKKKKTPCAKGSDKIKYWSFGNAEKEQLIQLYSGWHLH